MLANILAFSKVFFGLTLTLANTFGFALGLTLIVMSGVVFVVGNAKLLTPPKTQLLLGSTPTESLEGFLPLLESAGEKKSFTKLLEHARQQIESFGRKRATAQAILSQKFSPSEMSYEHFMNAIVGVQSVMAANCRNICNRLSAFDEAEYKQLQKAPKENQIVQARLHVLEAYFADVEAVVENNEQVLLKLDMLLAECSKFGSLSEGELEQLPAMHEIDQLIADAKYYGAN
jgi:hypothetical protein